MKAIDVQKRKTNSTSLPNEDFKVLFEWKIQKKSQINKGLLIGVFVFLLATAGFLFWQGNYFGAFVIFMAIFLIVMFQGGEEEIDYAILKRGVKIKKEIFPWKNLESFWVFEEIPEVYLKPKKAFIQNISLIIKKENAKKIRNILLKFLPEKETNISLSEMIFKKLGF